LNKSLPTLQFRHHSRSYLRDTTPKKEDTGTCIQWSDSTHN